MRKQIKRITSFMLAVLVLISSSFTYIPVHAEEGYQDDISLSYAKGTLHVKAEADAGVLPSGAELVVRQITNKDSKAQYQDAENKIQEKVSEKGQKLTSLAAYDIHFENDGAEIEPTGQVHLSMNWDNGMAPENQEVKEKASSIAVFHMKEEQDSVQAVELTGSKNTNETASVAKSGTDTVSNVEITSDSFSIFTIAWYDADDNNREERVSSAKIHFVDSAKNELKEPETSISNSQTVGTEVNLSNLGQNSVLPGYSYKNAILEDGTKISSLKSVKNENAYGLEYQVENSDTWMPLSDAEGNTVNVYLVYEKHALIHFTDHSGNKANEDVILDMSAYANNTTVDLLTYAEQYIVGYKTYADSTDSITLNDGAPVRFLKYQYAKDPGSNTIGSGKILYSTDGTNWTPLEGEAEITVKRTPFELSVHFINEEGNKIKADAAKGGSVISETGVNAEELADGIDGYKYIGVYTSKTSSEPISKIRLNFGNGTLQYALTDGVWKDLVNQEVWVVYRKTEFKRKVTVHYVDLAGVPITDETGKAVTKEIDAADWPTSGLNTKNDKAGNVYTDLGQYLLSFDGYAPFDPEHVNEGAATGPDGSRLMYQPASAGKTTRGAVKDARNFRFMRYNSSNNQVVIGRGARKDNVVTQAESINSDMDVYLFYRRVLTIHYVDPDGNEIHPAKIQKSDGSYYTIPYYNTYYAYDVNTADTRSSYGDPIAVYDRNPSDITKQEITSIGWKYENGWKTRLKLKDGSLPEQDSILSDVYMVYQKQPATSFNVTFHHVNARGEKVADDTTFKIDTSTSGAFTDKWNGFSTINQDIFGFNSSYGSYLGAYIGSKDQDHWTITGLLYKYDSSTDTWHTATGTTAVNGESEYTENGNPVLYQEVWIVYDSGKEITIHHQNTSGEQIADDTYIPVGNNMSFKASSAKESIKGYVYKEARIGTGIEGALFTQGAIKYVKNVWANVYYNDVNGELANLNVDGFINDVTLIYAPEQVVSVHYITKNGQKLKDDTELALTTDPVDLTGADLTQEIPYDSKNWEYQYSVLGLPSSDVQVTNVHFSNENKVYEISVPLPSNGNMEYADVNTWTVTATNGRKFTLRRSGSNFTLYDTNASYADMNLKSRADGAVIYTGTYEDTTRKIVYTVHQTNDATVRYALSVKEEVFGKERNIYQVYDVKTDEEQITLVDDLLNSGNLMVSPNSALKSSLANAGASNASYIWYKNGKPVDRKSKGNLWNLEENPKDRSYLNVLADGGRKGDIYYCEITFEKDGKIHTVRSNEVEIKYFDHVANGSFETPVGNDSYSNKAYENSNGIWQSTGIGTMAASGGKDLEADIEIVSTKGDNATHDRAKGYGFAPGSNGAYSSFKAKEGDQFAELNAETAGALYQDVLTVPGKSMNYWLSHRARGIEGSTTPEYDTMYMIIMPTKDALTAAPDGGELKEQSDLTSFIESHGGFDSSLAAANDAEITYNQNGILIEKISSSDQAWHSIAEAGKYVSSSYVTRMFFVAASTKADAEQSRKTNNPYREPTMGNFLDDIGFSYDFPKSDKLTLRVQKTFSGLDLEQAKKLADTFSLTVHVYKDATGTEEDATSFLDGAVLGFSAGKGDNLVLTAQKEGRSLLGNENEAEYTVSGTGTIVMNWTFQNVDVNGGTYYQVTENVGGMDQYKLTQTSGGNIQHTDGSQEKIQAGNWKTIPAMVSEGDTLSIEYQNTYKHQIYAIGTDIYTGGKGMGIYMWLAILSIGFTSVIVLTYCHKKEKIL